MDFYGLSLRPSVVTRVNIFETNEKNELIIFLVIHYRRQSETLKGVCRLCIYQPFVC